MKMSAGTRTARNHAGSRMKKEEGTRESAVKKVFGILTLVFGTLTAFIHIYELIYGGAHIVMWSHEFWRLAFPAACACTAFLAGLMSYRARFRAAAVSEFVFLPLCCAAAVVSVLIFGGEPVYFLPIAVFSAVLLVCCFVLLKKRVCGHSEIMNEL